MTFWDFLARHPLQGWMLLVLAGFFVVCMVGVICNAIKERHGVHKSRANLQ